MAKYDKITEMCEYCEIVYHPMLRATKGGETIFVCEFYIDEETGKLIFHDNCKNKAVADGYTLRRDLTPRR